MSTEDKLLSSLDSVLDKIKGFEQSHDAQKEASEKGIATLTAELDVQKQTLKEIAEKTAQINSRPSNPFQESCKAFGEAVCKAANEGTGTAGGYIVEDEQAQTIRSVQNEYGAVRRIYGSNIIPMMSDTMLVPVDAFEVSSSNTPTPAATSENAAITESNDAVLDQISLTASKYATLNYISNELLDDSFVDVLGTWLLPKIARQMAKIEDDVVFKTGFLGSSNIQSVVMAATNVDFTDVTFDNVFDMPDDVVTEALRTGKFYGHRSIFTILRKLKDSQNQYLWTPASSGEPNEIAGYEYEKVENMNTVSDTAVSTGFLLFGDPVLASVVGERLGRRITTSTEYRFNQDQTALRMVERFGWADNANTGRAMTVLTTAAS